MVLATSGPPHNQQCHRSTSRVTFTPNSTPTPNTSQSVGVKRSVSGLGSSTDCACIRHFVPPAISQRKSRSTWAKMAGSSHSDPPTHQNIPLALLHRQFHLSFTTTWGSTLTVVTRGDKRILNHCWEAAMVRYVLPRCFPPMLHRTLAGCERMRLSGTQGLSWFVC